jgi:uncharacterized protein with ParB-like and HNH nuclease domain/predicted transport protein
MKANEAKLLNFLHKAPQFVIPIYQRTYSWTTKECEQLWQDIVRCGSNDHIDVHFVGSVVYVADGVSSVTDNAPLLVIDGQQRLTTISILLATLAQLVEGEPKSGLSSIKLQHYYLLNPLESGLKRYKLILSKTDRDTLITLVDNIPLPATPSIRIQQNYEFFRNKIKDSHVDMVTVWNGLLKLMIVEVALDLYKDNPQLIFESMNSTGKELSQADLIRNYILMGLEHNFQTRMYEGYWYKIETKFGQEAYGTQFDGFMRYYLTIKTGRLVREYEVYDVYKDFSQIQRKQLSIQQHTEYLLAELYEFADIYCAVALGQETDGDLKRAFDDIRELRADVVYPFLMEVYRDFRSQIITKSDVLHIVRLVDSYVFRRAICGVPTNSMNRTFATLAKQIDKTHYVESVEAQFYMLTTYRRFPSDDEFQREFQTRDLYNFPRRLYYLRRLENYNRDELVSVGEYTIEHIMPQNPDLSSEWRRELGADWQRVQSTWLHTLGNLTLTAYNSTYSDRPFSEKRDMPSDPHKGIAKSPLHINEDVRHATHWNEATIKQRAARLAERGLKVWPSLSVNADTVKKYMKKYTRQEYGIEHFASIHTGKMKPLFEAFRQAVLDLDKNITEEFLKLYVAYKAETNFVDVIPYNDKLKLILNIPFIRIADSRGICVDISNKESWGNGEVEVTLKTIDEIPYIIGLVRQSLDAQLGGEE